MNSQLAVVAFSEFYAIINKQDGIITFDGRTTVFKLLLTVQVIQLSYVEFRSEWTVSSRPTEV